ncbi:MAG: polysaccharide biosynthesis/export family protein [Rhodobacteraceae bacterium]|nr:polysaccharide biosynthesis/export family protein [Paracoccaceae bacterium]
MCIRLLVILASSAALVSCSVGRTDFPIGLQDQTSTIEALGEELGREIEIVQLTPQNASAYNIESMDARLPTNLPALGVWNYRVGVGDVLDILAWNHEELAIPGGAADNLPRVGLRVQTSGTFFYPYVGETQAAGLLPSEIRQNLRESLTEYITDPQIEVRVAGYNSQHVSVTGEVKSPRRHALTALPLTLLEAVDAAGGLTEQADARRVTVRRNQQLYNVDLEAFLELGVSQNNPVLQDGDVVNVPELEKREAFLLGQIVRPSSIDITKETVNLTQALTRVGGLREGRADARGVFVFRDTGTGTGAEKTNVFQLNAQTPVAFLLGTQFEIQPQDVIYVTTLPVQKWNALITALLPTIRGVSTLDEAFDDVERR